MNKVLITFVLAVGLSLSCGNSESPKSTDNQSLTESPEEIKILQNELDSLDEKEKSLDQINKELEEMLSDLK